MKNTFKIFLGCAVLVSALTAGTVRSQGTAGASQLLIPVGTETVALSGTNVGTVAGVDALFTNVAGLEMVSNDYDPDRITVWPNPYYGYNPEERDALDRRVMFSHLPSEGPATIRIFALDGTLVRTIKHNDTGSQHTYWI